MSRQRDEEFETKFRNIKEYLKGDIRYNQKAIPRPFFIEFTGSPSAGKTTTISELDRFLRRFGLRVWKPQEGAEVIRHVERTTPIYNIRTGLYALNLLIDLSVGHQYDIVFFDRCIFDAYTWMIYWEEKGKLAENDRRLFQQFFTSRLWQDHLDAVFIMVCEPERAMERELKLSLTQKDAEATNPTMIRTMLERYKRAYSELAPEHPQLHLIDTTHLEEKEMVSVITDKLLNILGSKI